MNSTGTVQFSSVQPVQFVLLVRGLTSALIDAAESTNRQVVA